MNAATDLNMFTPKYHFLIFFLITGAIGPRSGPGAGKKASYGSGKQTLRLKANGTAAIEEVDNSRTLAEDNINKLLENFMGINDSELGMEMHCRCCLCLSVRNSTLTICAAQKLFLNLHIFSFSNLGPGGGEEQHDGVGRGNRQLGPRGLRFHGRLHLRAVGRDHRRQVRAREDNQ